VTGAAVTDLLPLAGLPLVALNVRGTAVRDLQPLRACPCGRSTFPARRWRRSIRSTACRCANSTPRGSETSGRSFCALSDARNRDRLRGHGTLAAGRNLAGCGAGDPEIIKPPCRAFCPVRCQYRGIPTLFDQFLPCHARRFRGIHKLDADGTARRTGVVSDPRDAP